MKRTTTIVTCDLCGHISYGDTVETRKWELHVDRSSHPNPASRSSSYVDLCPSCYEGLVRYISSRRPKRTNKNQMTFDNDFPEFVTEEKSGDYFEILSKSDPEPWKT
ncbi:MAG: hypothetical protein J6Y02_12980 [Pseudobutyrivibrio sp.]|nr:hypothetical protein [Pseudobutyrivibrio sp.]